MVSNLQTFPPAADPQAIPLIDRVMDAFRRLTSALPTKKSKDSLRFDAKMIERSHRSQIFDKILKDVENGGSQRPRPRPPQKQPQQQQQPQKPKQNSVQDIAAHREKAERAFARKDYETALADYQYALELSEHSDLDPVDLIRLHLAYGFTLQKLNRYEDSTNAYNRADSVLETIAGPAAQEIQVSVELHRARLEAACGEFSRAEKLYINAINRYEEHGSAEPLRLGRLYAELGRVYAEADYLDTAMEIVLQSLSILEDAKEPVFADQMKVFQQLANIAFKKNELKAAESHLLEAYRLGQQSDDVGNLDLSQIEVAIATVYAQLGDLETANQWLLNAIQRQEQEDAQQWPLSLLYVNLALIKGRQPEGQDESLDCFWRSLGLQIGNLSSI